MDVRTESCPSPRPCPSPNSLPALPTPKPGQGNEHHAVVDCESVPEPGFLPLSEPARVPVCRIVPEPVPDFLLSQVRKHVCAYRIVPEPVPVPGFLPLSGR